MSVKEIITLKVETDLQVCPDCGYDRGFHVSFINMTGSRSNPVRSTREVFRVILTCPECGARYDVGWRVPLETPETRFTRVPGQAQICVPHGKPADCLPARITNGNRPPE